MRFLSRLAAVVVMVVALGGCELWPGVSNVSPWSPRTRCGSFVPCCPKHTHLEFTGPRFVCTPSKR